MMVSQIDPRSGLSANFEGKIIFLDKKVVGAAYTEIWY